MLVPVEDSFVDIPEVIKKPIRERFIPKSVLSEMCTEQDD